MDENGRGEPDAARASREASTGAGRSDSAAFAATVESGDLLLRFLAQLSRFGLAAGGEPLLKPARPSAG